MADKIKKVPEEVKENIEEVLEGAISDDEAEAAAGGYDYLRQSPENKQPDRVKPIIDMSRPR